MTNRLAGAVACCVAAAAAVVLASGCSSSDAQANPPAVQPWGAQRIVAIDLSSSRDSVQLAESQGVASRIVDALQNGDEIVFQQVYERGLAGGARQWHDTVPAASDPLHPQPSDRTHVERVRREAHAELPVFFDVRLAGRIQGTDLTSTLYRVSDLARTAGHRRTTLYLLSDMLQWTPELELERALPPRGWVADHQRRGLLPDLRNVCVIAIGPDVTTDHGVAVRRFWKEYFTAAGAVLRDENYLNSAESLTGLGC